MFSRWLGSLDGPSRGCGLGSRRLHCTTRLKGAGEQGTCQAPSRPIPGKPLPEQALHPRCQTDSASPGGPKTEVLTNGSIDLC